MDTIRFLTCPPPPALAGAIKELWLLDDAGGYVAGLPKPYVELIISLSGVHWWRAAPGAREHRYIGGWVTPLQHGPRYARSVGRRRLIGARLDPRAAVALFGPLPRGTGQPPPPLEQIIGGEAHRLRARLIEAADDADRFARFSAWLEGWPALRRFAGDAFERNGRSASVAALANDLRLTPRALRRRFAVDAGMSPKQWLRLHRLDAVLRDPALGDSRHPLTQVAHAHGYADQAHFARDIARLTGSTASAIRRRPERSPPHFLPQD